MEYTADICFTVLLICINLLAMSLCKYMLIYYCESIVVHKLIYPPNKVSLAHKHRKLDQLSSQIHEMLVRQGFIEKVDSGWLVKVGRGGREGGGRGRRGISQSQAPSPIKLSILRIFSVNSPPQRYVHTISHGSHP